MVLVVGRCFVTSAKKRYTRTRNPGLHYTTRRAFAARVAAFFFCFSLPVFRPCCYLIFCSVLPYFSNLRVRQHVYAL